MRRNLNPSTVLAIVLGLALGAEAYSQATSPRRGVQVVTPASSPSIATGSYHALVIGNNRYQKLNHLATAVNDANAIGKLLQDQYGFNTKVLLNATRNDIINALVEYRRTLPPDSNLLIYYAGHGAHDRDAEEAYWLPVDAASSNDANWISSADITSNIRAIASRHVLIVSDSCYSGALSDNRMRGVHTSIDPRETDRFLAKVLRETSRTILSSGGDEPVADTGGNGHSIFAQALLDGLAQMDDNLFTAGDLYETYVKRKVAGRSDQDPHYFPLARSGDSGGDFIFFRQSLAPAPTGVAKTSVTQALSSAATSTGDSSRTRSDSASAHDSYQAKNDAAAFDSFKSLASRGDARAMYVLGEMYATGKGTDKSHEEAVRWYRAGADAGNADAMSALGDLYLKGDGVTQDSAEAMSWYRKAADTGSSTALLYVASLYLNGQGIKQDYEQAFSSFHKAADAGNPEAMTRVADLYRSGKGVPQDYAQAMTWYRKAAGAGNANALAGIGELYQNGNGVSRDYAEARSWYRKAADAGSPAGMRDLGLSYRDGLDVDKNPSVARQWLYKAAGLGDTRAMIAYADSSLPLHNLEPLEWYSRAAAAGDADGMNALGHVYLTGRGAGQNFPEAMRWYRRAADAGSVAALEGIGRSYLWGYNVWHNYAQAMLWFRKAAEAGDANGLEGVGELYYMGYGVAKDNAEAMRWLQKAVDGGNSEAMFYIGDVYAHGNGVAQDYVQAAVWYRKAAADDEHHESIEAMKSLAKLYENGQGVPVSPHDALAWYQKAAYRGDRQAQNAVRRLETTP